MNTPLVRSIALFAIFIGLGILTLTTAALSSLQWLSITTLCVSITDFVMAGFMYRRILRIAKVIDECNEYNILQNELFLILISRIYGKDESKSETKEQGEAPCQDQSENEYAHPV